MKTIIAAGKIAVMAAAVSAGTAHANMCDYRPSAGLGAATSAAVTTGSGAIAAAGGAMKASGLYSITHSSGIVMLGSTAPGSSAAGTVGIIAGSGGALGTIGGALLSPFVLIPAAAVAAGLASFEVGCRMAD